MATKKRKKAAKSKTTSSAKSGTTSKPKAAAKPKKPTETPSVPKERLGDAERRTKVKAPNLRPLGDRILVKRLEPQDVVRGGIIIPDSAKEKPQEGIVVALGQGRKLKSNKVIPFEVKIGDRVVIEKYTGSEVTIEGEEYTIISEDGVLAVLER